MQKEAAIIRNTNQLILESSTSANDVLLCGDNNITTNNNTHNDHDGNHFFVQIIRERQEQFMQCKNEKEEERVVEEVLDVLMKLNPPGRFLRRVEVTVESKNSNDDDSQSLSNANQKALNDLHSHWFELSKAEARDKVLQALREATTGTCMSVSVERKKLDLGDARNKAWQTLREDAMTKRQKLGSNINIPTQDEREIRNLSSSLAVKLQSKEAIENNETMVNTSLAKHNQTKHTNDIIPRDIKQCFSKQQEIMKRQDEIDPTNRQDLENRMLLNEFSAPVLMAAWNPIQQQNLKQMNVEAGNYFEAGLSGISVDDFFRTQERVGHINTSREKKHVYARVADALKAMGENSLADSYSE